MSRDPRWCAGAEGAILVVLILALIGATFALGDDDFEGLKVDFEEGGAESWVKAFFTGNMYGTMGRSSCTDPQLGGLERRRAFCLQCLPDSDDCILVDTGNLLNVRCERERVKAFYIIAAYNMMAYDAISLGPKDFVFGLDLLRTLQEKAKFPFISANVVDFQTDEPIFTPYLIAPCSGATVCVTGVVSTSYGDFIQDCTKDEDGQPLVSVLDPVMAIEDVFKQVEGTASVIVAVGQVSAREAMEIAGRLPSIDLFITSDRQHGGEVIYGDTVIADIGTKCKFLTGAALVNDPDTGASWFNVEEFPIIEEMEHSQSMFDLCQRFRAGIRSLKPERHVQPRFYVSSDVYDEPPLKY